MNENEFPPTGLEREELFRKIDRLVKNKLPVSLKGYKPLSEYKKNYIKFIYSEFKNGWYEFQFVHTSREHKDKFGDFCQVVLAFYLKDNLDIQNEWMESLLPFKEKISQQLNNKRVFIDHWRNDWAVVAIKLGSQTINEAAEAYSNWISRFIQATYEPIQKTYESI